MLRKIINNEAVPSGIARVSTLISVAQVSYQLIKGHV